MRATRVSNKHTRLVDVQDKRCSPYDELFLQPVTVALLLLHCPLHSHLQPQLHLRLTCQSRSLLRLLRLCGAGAVCMRGGER